MLVLNNLAFKDFLELLLVDLMNADIRSNHSTNNRTVRIRVTSKCHSLKHCEIVQLFNGLFSCSHEKMHGENKGVFDETDMNLWVIVFQA